MIVDDVIVQHLRFDLLVRAHLLAHGAFHTSQTSAVLVLDELANGAHASVTKVVDVVDVGFLALTLDQAAHGLDDILARERGYHRDRARPDRARSEEHTSELQSRGHLVCRLLLEKKKNNKN